MNTPQPFNSERQKTAHAHPTLVLLVAPQTPPRPPGQGGAGAPSYANLLAVYDSAAELASGQADAVIERFRPRFAKIVRDAGKIGWGFHDGLEDAYWEFLPEAEEPN